MKTWNRNTIDLKEYYNKDIVIHCDNEEKSNDLLEYLDKQGIKWASGSKLTEKNYYCIYEGVICYNYEFDGISCSDTRLYESNEYDIVKWEIVNKNQQKNIERKTYLYTINGTIEVDMDIDTLNDKFIEFIESINGEFGGGII